MSMKMDNKKTWSPQISNVPSMPSRRSCMASLVGTALTIGTGITSPKETNAMKSSTTIDTGIDSVSTRWANSQIWTVTLPLEECGGGGLCARLTVSGIPSLAQNPPGLPFRVFKAIIDTGSPYLVIPEEEEEEEGDDFDFFFSKTTENPLFPFSQWFASTVSKFTPTQNLNDGLIFEESGYPPTEEIYGSQSGAIQWKKAVVKFRDPNLVSASSIVSSFDNQEQNEKNNVNKNKLVFGLMDKTLTRESGGSLLGLVKRSNLESTKVQLRPTFLDQERIEISPSSLLQLNQGERETKQNELIEVPIKSFALNEPNRTLTFSNKSLLPPPNHKTFLNIVPLVDLRPLGDFVEHYTCNVENLFINGRKMNQKESLPSNRKIVAVFDSGLTGCLFTKPLWDELKNNASFDPETTESIEIQVCTKYASKTSRKHPQAFKNLNNIVSIISSKSSSRLFYVAPISLDWFDDEVNSPHVVVLGQTFLEKGILTVDIENREALFEVM